jgi:hypothetical protein
MDTITHVHTPPMGGVDAKVTHSTQGISLEVDVTRPRQEGETFEQAAEATAALVADAYEKAVLAIQAKGWQIGPFKKAEGK